MKSVVIFYIYSVDYLFMIIYTNEQTNLSQANIKNVVLLLMSNVFINLY